MDGETQKKQFVFPKKEQLIEQIKQLEDQIEHVSLNLIKCDFNATQKDVEKTFPEFKFLKIKNYNPGSFEVIFDMKIDAINFIRNCYDRKILTRRFFIKLGRQTKEIVEDWACVGHVPKKFNNKNHQKNHHYKKNHQKKKEEGEDDTKGEEKKKQKKKYQKQEKKVEKSGEEEQEKEVKEVKQ